MIIDGGRDGWIEGGLNMNFYLFVYNSFLFLTLLIYLFKKSIREY